MIEVPTLLNFFDVAHFKENTYKKEIDFKYKTSTHNRIQIYNKYIQYVLQVNSVN